MPRRPRQPETTHPLAARIRAECQRRGWSLGELAKRSGISRTTLYHLEQSRTGQPHLETVRKIAGALGLPIASLMGAELPPLPGRGSAARTSTSRDPARSRFDAATNPAVADVMREQPQLFAGWTADDVDELCSLFGTGGGLTPRGVELAAESINRRRETVHKLQIVLETHLSKHAMEMVDMLYDLVQPPQMREPPSPPREAL